MECLLVHFCDQGSSTPSPDSGVFFENTLIVFEPGLGWQHLWIFNSIPLCQILNKTLGVQPLHMVNMEYVFPLGL